MRHICLVGILSLFMVAPLPLVAMESGEVGRLPCSALCRAWMGIPDPPPERRVDREVGPLDRIGRARTAPATVAGPHPMEPHRRHSGPPAPRHRRLPGPQVVGLRFAPPVAAPTGHPKPAAVLSPVATPARAISPARLPATPAAAAPPPVSRDVPVAPLE